LVVFTVAVALLDVFFAAAFLTGAPFSACLLNWSFYEHL
jgi:hypothetical protein